MGKRLWLSIAAIVIAVAAGIYYYRSDVAAEAPTLSTAEVTQGDVVATDRGFFQFRGPAPDGSSDL